jgi:hypothetical protein
MGFGGIVVIVNGHFRAVPVFSERRQAGTQVRRVRFINPTGPQVRNLRFEERHEHTRLIAQVHAEADIGSARVAVANEEAAREPEDVITGHGEARLQRSKNCA